MATRIDDGFSTTIEFTDFPTVEFWEKTVTPPGVQGGGGKETTTMRNTSLRTKAPKKLKSMGDASASCAYSAAVLDDCFAMINVNQLIKYHLADGAQWHVWGWVDEFVPDEIVEGEQPTAQVTILASNQNASGVETAPVYVPAP